MVVQVSVRTRRRGRTRSRQVLRATDVLSGLQQFPPSSKGFPSVRRPSVQRLRSLGLLKELLRRHPQTGLPRDNSRFLQKPSLNNDPNSLINKTNTLPPNFPFLVSFS